MADFTHAVPAERQTVLAFGGNILGAGKENVYVPDTAQGDDEDYPVLVADQDIDITRVVWVPQADVTGAATNNFGLALVNIGDEGASSGDVDITVEKVYVSGTDSAENEAEELTLAVNVDHRKVADGDVVVFRKENNGDGLAAPQGIVQVYWVSQRA